MEKIKKKKQTLMEKAGMVLLMPFVVIPLTIYCTFMYGFVSSTIYNMFSPYELDSKIFYGTYLLFMVYQAINAHRKTPKIEFINFMVFFIAPWYILLSALLISLVI